MFKFGNVEHYEDITLGILLRIGVVCILIQINDFVREMLEQGHLGNPLGLWVNTNGFGSAIKSYNVVTGMMDNGHPGTRFEK